MTRSRKNRLRTKNSRGWLVLSAVLLLQGCTTRAWFEVLQERERSRCYEHVSNDAVEACLKQVEEMSYDQYRRSREK